MATRFYLHAATNSTSGLPTTLQSSLTPEANKGDALTLNRLMNTSIGTSQTSIAISTVNNTSAHNYYFTRFASQPIYQSSVAANTWTYFFAAQESNTSANFPVTSNNKAIRITCYVWRPSDSSIVGWILEGASAATVDEGSAGSELAKVVTFSGSAVNNVQDGDVIIFEVIFQITQGSATTYTDTYFFDGTQTYTDGTPASDAASYIETPEDLTLSQPQQVDRSLTTETLAISESLNRTPAHNKSQSLTTETLDISEPNAPVLLRAKQRQLSTETVSITETPTRLSAKQRSQTTETLTITESSDVLREKQRPLSTETLDISESVSQESSNAGPRNIEKGLPTESLTISDSYSRMTAKWRKIG